MATDPVELINRETLGGPRAADLLAMLRRLAALPPSTGTPYLTVTADLRPEGGSPNRRPGVETVERDLRAAADGFAAHDPARLCLDRAIPRLVDAMRAADPAMLGFFAVVCGEGEVFEALAVPSPLPSAVRVAPTPQVLELARAVEENPAAAILVADGREATLLVTSAASPDAVITVETDPFPRKQMQGGWSQQRYQNRADERLEAFARTLAAELRRMVEAKEIDLVIVAADDPMKSTVVNELHPMVRDRLAGELSLALDLAPQALVEHAMPLLQAAARKREMDKVAAVREGAGPGGRSVAGIDETLAALQTGQVMDLVVNDDFAAVGWADFSQNIYGAGPVPSEHPAGGDVGDLRVVALEQELARLALQFDAGIEVVQSGAPVAADDDASTNGRPSDGRAPAARELDALGGVGALLRFTLAADRSTAEM
jgi:protein required for attachment to host cells